MRKTIVYIDGFNLYYRLKSTPYKWLNLQKLSSFYLDSKKHNIIKIKYFTAPVKAKLKDPHNTIRQNVYLRALRTIPNMEIVLGHFKKRQVKGALSYYQKGKYIEGTDIVTVTKWEEKESDVNMAIHLIEDGYENQYDCAVLISNDTDLKTPLSRVKRKLKKLVGVISPYKTTHIALQKFSHFHKTISVEALQQCQFSEKMQDAKGPFFCPPEWKRPKG